MSTMAEREEKFQAIITDVSPQVKQKAEERMEAHQPIHQAK